MLNLASSAQALARAFTQPDVVDLALLLEFFQSLHRLLYRSLLIEAVSVVQIDVLNAQSLQRLLARLLRRFRGRINRHVTINHAEAKFRSEEDVFSCTRISLEPFRQEHLTVCVEVGCVPEETILAVHLVKDSKALLIWFWRAIQRALELRKSAGVGATRHACPYEAHGAISNA